MEKTAQLVHDVTDGALSPSVGMLNGLCREFSLKSRQEQDKLFQALLDSPVMHVDGTVARVNGNNNNVVVCSNGTASMYFARENKGHTVTVYLYPATLRRLSCGNAAFPYRCKYIHSLFHSKSPTQKGRLQTLYRFITALALFQYKIFTLDKTAVCL